MKSHGLRLCSGNNARGGRGAPRAARPRAERTVHLFGSRDSSAVGSRRAIAKRRRMAEEVAAMSEENHSRARCAQDAKTRSRASNPRIGRPWLVSSSAPRRLCASFVLVAGPWPAEPLFAFFGDLDWRSAGPARLAEKNGRCPKKAAGTSSIQPRFCDLKSAISNQAKRGASLWPIPAWRFARSPTKAGCHKKAQKGSCVPPQLSPAPIGAPDLSSCSCSIPQTRPSFAASPIQP